MRFRYGKKTYWLVGWTPADPSLPQTADLWVWSKKWTQVTDPVEISDLFSDIELVLDLYRLTRP